NPVPSRGPAVVVPAPTSTAPARIPRIADPKTLTVNVPHGKSESCRRCTNRSVRYRSGAPTAPPAATNTYSSPTAAPGPRGAPADVLDDGHLVEDHQAFADQFVQLRQESVDPVRVVDDDDRQRQ